MDKNQNGQKIFPKGFLWGASTAAHQVEGGTLNQWTVWELAHAGELAKSAPTRLKWLPVWDEIKDQATDPGNYVSGRGVEHYQHFREDFDIAKSLNLNAFRFGIEWSRVEPEEGIWDQEALDHYKTYIAELKKRGLEPFLNIWHWTVPTWFADKGGFAKGRNLHYFNVFVEKIAEVYGKDLKYVITLNEPNIYMTYSYTTGEFPPQERNLIKGTLVYWNLVRAHRLAYKALKRVNPRLKIGIAAQLANIQAKRPHNIFDESTTKFVRYLWNWWFLNRTNKFQDFIGFNYYYTDYYKGFSRDGSTDKVHNDQEVLQSTFLKGMVRENPKIPINDLGNYMEPEGLYPLLVRIWARYHKPIIVTENGVADAHDQYRQWWLEESIIAMERALSEGVDIRGYLHWSLLDNFEWNIGWWPKFGLVAVDRERGMKRVIRPSAKWFAKRIKDLKSD